MEEANAFGKKHSANVKERNLKNPRFEKTVREFCGQNKTIHILTQVELS